MTTAPYTDPTTGYVYDYDRKQWSDPQANTTWNPARNAWEAQDETAWRGRLSATASQFGPDMQKTIAARRKSAAAGVAERAGMRNWSLSTPMGGSGGGWGGGTSLVERYADQKARKSFPHYADHTRDNMAPADQPMTSWGTVAPQAHNAPDSMNEYIPGQNNADPNSYNYVGQYRAPGYDWKPGPYYGERLANSGVTRSGPKADPAANVQVPDPQATTGAPMHWAGDDMKPGEGELTIGGVQYVAKNGQWVLKTPVTRRAVASI